MPRQSHILVKTWHVEESKVLGNLQKKGSFERRLVKGKWEERDTRQGMRE